MTSKLILRLYKQKLIYIKMLTIFEPRRPLLNPSCRYARNPHGTQTTPVAPVVEISTDTRCDGSITLKPNATDFHVLVSILRRRLRSLLPDVSLPRVA